MSALHLAFSLMMFFVGCADIAHQILSKKPGPLLWS